MEFALCVESGVLALLLRCEGILDWSEAYYQWWLNAPENRVLPPRPGQGPDPVSDPSEERPLVTGFLIDNRTGILAGMRAFTWSPAFSDRLSQEIRRQARSTWKGRDEYRRQIERLNRKYPTVHTFLETALIRTYSGE